MARVFIFMMDSFGIGGAPDAAAFGDEGAATFEHIAAAYPNLNIPNLLSLGLAKAAHEASGLNINLSPVSAQTLNLPAAYGHMKEISRDKDTVSGHWEMAGLPNLQGWGHFKPDCPSFPQELIEQICRDAELDGILGNKAASGTVIIQELGEEHLQTGRPICYTSADSCFQIAAHENISGLRNYTGSAKLPINMYSPTASDVSLPAPLSEKKRRIHPHHPPSRLHRPTFRRHPVG